MDRPELDVDDDMFGTLVREVPDAVVLVDRDGTVQFANPAVEAVLGYEPGDLVGRNYEVLVPEHVRVGHAAHHLKFRAAPAARPMGVGLSLRARHRDGSLVPVEISLVPMRGGDLVAVFVRDTGDRQRLIDRLAATNTVINAVLADSDHDHVCRLVVRLARLLLDADSSMLVHEDGSSAEQATAVVDDPEDAPDALDRLPPGWDAELRAAGFARRGGEGCTGTAGPLLAVPLRTDKHRYGTFVVTRRCGSRDFDDHDLQALRDFADACGLALEVSESRRDLARLALLEDHDRIARDLHDMVIQRIFAVALRLEAASEVVDGLAAERMQEAVAALDGVIRDLRTSIFGLRTMDEEPGGLRARIRAEVEQVRSLLGFLPRTTFTGPIDTATDESLADDAVAVVREALSNVVRHAGASSVEVVVHADDRRLRIEVLDDGVGPAEVAGGGESESSTLSMWNALRPCDS